MKTNYMIIGFTFVLFLSSVAHAQSGGDVGGGEPTARDFQGYIDELDNYLLSKKGRYDFPEVQQPEFHNKLLQVRPVVKDVRVYDSYGIAQACVSYATEGDRHFQCDLKRLPKIDINNQQTFYSLTFHELLFQVGLELPISKDIPSDFRISSRLKFHRQAFEKWLPGEVGQCGIIIEYVNLYNGPRIGASSDLGLPRSAGSTNEGIKLFQLFSGKEYQFVYSRDDASYKLIVETNYGLSGLSPWYTANLTLVKHGLPIAMSTGMGRSFSPDFIAENEPAFRRMKNKAFSRSIYELASYVKVCE